MKKAFLLILAFLALSSGLKAQDYRTPEDAQPLYVAPVYAPVTADDYFYMMPLDEQMSMIYGSSYRKAKSRLSAGLQLSVMAAPLFIATGLAGLALTFGEGDIAGAGVIAGVTGLIGTGASLGAGIPLWIKGRRELDNMMDDYSRRYAPRPSISMGTTANGFGLALNF